MMDGQVLVLKDYLEVRPENRPRVESLVKAGRLLVAWYSQPNEYMVTASR
jgi:mannosylglycerate hydrolase